MAENRPTVLQSKSPEIVLARKEARKAGWQKIQESHNRTRDRRKREAKLPRA